MTAKEKLHKRVDALSEEEAERLLPLFDREQNGEGVGEAIAEGYQRVPQDPEEDAWAEANAREAIRQERW